MQNIHKLNHILWLKQTHGFEYAQLPSKWTLLELCLEMHQFLRAPKLFSRRHISISKIFAAKRKMRDSVIWYFQLVLHQIRRLQREGTCNNFILQSLWKCGRKKRDFAWTLSENASIFAGAEIIFKTAHFNSQNICSLCESVNGRSKTRESLTLRGRFSKR